MKSDILILCVSPGFNENQNWITYLPYDYSKMYSKTQKFNGLKLFNFEKKYRIRVDKNIIDILDIGDILQKATIEYDIVQNGTFNDTYKFKKITIGNKVIDLTK